MTGTTGHHIELRACLQIIAFLFLGLASAIGNIIINIAIWKLGRSRMIGHYFILSLSWSDLYLGIFVVPLSVSELLAGAAVTTTAYWCKLSAGLALTAIIGTSWNIAAISVDRFIAIYYPFFYQANVKAKSVMTAITFIWIGVITWAFLPVIGWAPDFNYQRAKLTLCVWPLVLDNKYFSITLVSVFVAVFIVTVLQTLIFIAARKQSRKIWSRQVSFSRARDRSIFVRRQRKITRMVGFVVAFFMLTYLPWMIILARNMFAGNANQIAILVSLCFIYLNSAANPWVYAITDSKLRWEIKKLLKRLLRQPVQERRRLTVAAIEDDNSSSAKKNGFPNGENNNDQL